MPDRIVITAICVWGAVFVAVVIEQVSAPAPLTCTAIRVVDGDTLVAGCPAAVRVRVADVDAPERGDCPVQAEASAARLRALTAGGFTARPLYLDRYGRTVATLTDPQGADIAAALIATGHARPWPHDRTGHALASRPEGCE